MSHAEEKNIFIDWITISQIHEGASLPVIASGAIVFYDGFGIPRFEKASPARFGGSYETSLQIKCDGSFVSLNGNVGRFSRRDNLFNLGWRETVEKCNRIMLDKSLPVFTPRGLSPDLTESRGARLSRLDITANFACGSESQARHLIRWLADRSVSRMKKGRAGDESVWWSNTRHMIKAYIKHIEMEKHGMKTDDPVYEWCRDNGIVRVEVELKKRMLHDEGMHKLENVTDQKIQQIFEAETEIFRRVDRSDEPDILDAIPSRYRVTAAAWLAGEDLRTIMSNGTLYRHAKILREYGLDITEPRNVTRFPTKVHVVELKPVSPPDWYRFDDEFNQPLKLVVNK
ncbi:phage/plasmid replication protein [Nitrosomonas sp. Nm34]|uniref:phage/plasmid replication domain-containing protein n=1 Tax=Nitrosomonas sp. Nm34 TaxID=1881055 RepID=UPI0008E88044|nr:phage/plasmid replication protein [Nitrosomonas sp. Nm34]SFJ01537.1 phage/plasmid replication protein, gene II/X family [Nitrosomonas sp. Nm34]